MLISAPSERESTAVDSSHRGVRDPSGVSVVICCHNSELLLPQTIAHLKAQRVHPELEWEVLVVDNASSDGTVSAALKSWSQDGPVPMRVVRESRLGLSYARERALQEARYDIIGFIDDDNWVCETWVAAVADTFARHPALGAVGSLVYPVFEITPPTWWYGYGADYFALMLEPREPLFLSGAGLAIRTAAWRRLCERGFKSRLVGRKGKMLSGGEDTELTMALRLSGWRLAISPHLRLQHFMPSNRLQWKYLRRLVRGYTASHVLLDAYNEYSISLTSARRLVGDGWWYQLARTVGMLARQPRSVIAATLSKEEGRADVIAVDKLFGRAMGLLGSRRRYALARRHVRMAHWRETSNVLSVRTGHFNQESSSRPVTEL